MKWNERGEMDEPLRTTGPQRVAILASRVIHGKRRQKKAYRVGKTRLALHSHVPYRSGNREDTSRAAPPATRGADNLMPRMLDAADAYATVGEIAGKLKSVFARVPRTVVIRTGGLCFNADGVLDGRSIDLITA